MRISRRSKNMNVNSKFYPYKNVFIVISVIVALVIKWLCYWNCIVDILKYTHCAHSIHIYITDTYTYIHLVITRDTDANVRNRVKR